jgi:hypothetical protein
VLRIDHVVRVVRDLDAAADAWLREHGLATVAGGTHPRWGTANRIAPLGGAYLELIAVVDDTVATTTVLGRALLDRLEGGDAWFALCLADDDIEGTAARLGLAVDPGSRERPDGVVLAWRGAGIDDARRTPDLPFFIAWDVPPALHPAAAPLDQPGGADAIAWVEIAGDPTTFAAWTGEAELPIRSVTGDRPGIVRVGLHTSADELALS